MIPLEKKKAWRGTRWKVGTALESSSAASGTPRQTLSHTLACEFASSRNILPAPRPAPGKGWPRGIFQQNQKVYPYTCVPSLQALRNVNSSNPHLQRLDQHLKLTRNSSNPLGPGTPGAPAQSSLLNQLRFSSKALGACAVCYHKPYLGWMLLN